MDRAREMMLFAKVVEEGSFSAASRALDLTPSAVSKQISRLEYRLGARLINRTTRRLHLTEAGQHFYDHCARINAEIERAELEICHYQEQVRGQLRENRARKEMVPGGLSIVTETLRSFFNGLKAGPGTPLGSGGGCRYPAS